LVLTLVMSSLVAVALVLGASQYDQMAKVLQKTETSHTQLTQAQVCAQGTARAIAMRCIEHA
jgi:hypothetical protein